MDGVELLRTTALLATLDFLPLEPVGILCRLQLLLLPRLRNKSLQLLHLRLLLVLAFLLAPHTNPQSPAALVMFVPLVIAVETTASVELLPTTAETALLLEPLRESVLLPTPTSTSTLVLPH